MSAAARRWTWGVTAAAVVLALMTEALLFLKALGCGAGEYEPRSCDGLTGSGHTLATVIFFALPAAAVIALVGGWTKRRSLSLLALVGVAVAMAWVQSAGLHVI